MSTIHWHDFDRGHLRRAALRWGAVGLFVLVAHAAFVYAAVFMEQEAQPAEAPAAVMIELAAIPVSAPSTVEDVAPGPQMVQSPEAVKDAPDTPEDAVPPPEPATRQTVEETPPEPSPAPAPPDTVEDTPEPLPAPTPSEVVLPLPKPEILKAEMEPRAEQAKTPEKTEPKKTETRKTERRKERERTASRRRSAPATSAAPRSQAAPARQSAAPSQGASASRSLSRASWAAQVSAHLNRFKRYPPAARGSSGRPSVRFTLNGSGRVTSVSLSRSSGNSALDQEALATVRRASPFPRPPDGNGASFSVPVNFVSR